MTDLDALRRRHYERISPTGVSYCIDCGHPLVRKWPCDAIRAADRIEALEKALRTIDELPAGHYRRNGFASPDPWLRQREVRRIVRAVLAEGKADG